MPAARIAFDELLRLNLRDARLHLVAQQIQHSFGLEHILSRAAFSDFNEQSRQPCYRSLTDLLNEFVVAGCGLFAWRRRVETFSAKRITVALECAVSVWVIVAVHLR